ncbi:tRNA uracil 4-sulfurtransferase ThiI [Sebaldella sp. S0638]|uniref:tRNA uracil 4-sulfurtransferase ThiI n=1 Tax=Sebaldella sp. S0638 TaxID=2957809 RepID=UPI00209FAF6B|nr:tRNA uracil 4-sulfurtransferase ThiI [Sebaldella sp. S0638]MCP1223274.1 tRNA 4-thiouridine(8) synthase ThiI [Sebaldella sp. S0638]
MYNALGISYGELALKGKNRGNFERILNTRIRNILKGTDYKLTIDSSKLYILSDQENIDEIIRKIKKIFGIVLISPSVRVENDEDEIKKAVLEIAERAYDSGARNFKVDVKRNNKKFQKKSMDFAKELGGHILVNSKFEHVKMKNADVTIYLEIRNSTYICTEKIKTYGGLPLGTTGKGLVLLSGGIDSPVAAFMMAKRGMFVNAVTFHSFPFTSTQALEKVKDLSEILSLYIPKTRLFSMNILKIQQEINQKTNKDLATILTRRVMMRLAERLAKDRGFGALITGESLGQVASQTIGGLTCTNASVKDIPVFRPLIGMDKTEIINIATEIDTYEKSIEPYEDSCVIFAPKHPVTNPKLENVLIEEEKIEDYNELMEEIYNNMEIFTFE